MVTSLRIVQAETISFVKDTTEFKTLQAKEYRSCEIVNSTMHEFGMKRAKFSNCNFSFNNFQIPQDKRCYAIKDSIVKSFFEYCIFEGCYFEHCNFDSLLFKNCTFIDCHFSFCDFIYSEISFSNLTNCTFYNSRLKEMAFFQTSLQHTEYSFCVMQDLKFNNHNITGRYLKDISLQGTKAISTNVCVVTSSDSSIALGRY